MRRTAYIGVIFLFLGVFLSPKVCATSCKFVHEPVKETLQSTYIWADMVAVGTVLEPSQLGQADFAVEAIWKGPDFELLSVGARGKVGTRMVVYARHGGLQANDYPIYGVFACHPRMRDVRHEDLIAMTEELFGQPRKPDVFVTSFVFTFGLVLAFTVLISISFVVYRQVALNKSLNTDASDAGAG